MTNLDKLNKNANRTAKVFQFTKLSQQPWRKQIDTERLKSFQCVNKRNHLKELKENLGPTSYTKASFTDGLYDRNNSKKGTFSKLDRFETETTTERKKKKGMKSASETYFRPASPKLYLEKYREPAKVFMGEHLSREDSFLYKCVEKAQNFSLEPVRYSDATMKNKSIGGYDYDKLKLERTNSNIAKIAKTGLPIQRIQTAGYNQRAKSGKVRPKSTSSRNSSSLSDLEDRPDSAATFYPENFIATFPKHKNVYKPSNNHSISFLHQPTGNRLLKTRKQISVNCPFYEVNKRKQLKYGKFKRLHKHEEAGAKPKSKTRGEPFSQEFDLPYDTENAKYFPLVSIHLDKPNDAPFDHNAHRFYKRDVEFETSWIDPSAAEYDLGRYQKYAFGW